MVKSISFADYIFRLILLIDLFIKEVPAILIKLLTKLHEGLSVLKEQIYPHLQDLLSEFSREMIKNPVGRKFTILLAFRCQHRWNKVTSPGSGSLKKLV